MDAVELGVNLFVTLFALLDPVGNLPIFAAAIDSTALVIAVTVMRSSTSQSSTPGAWWDRSSAQCRTVASRPLRTSAGTW